MLKKYFRFEELGTNYRTEFMAGLTTFLAMAYILFVNPNVLGATGMDQGAVFTATAIAAAVGTFVMGVLARYPVALAPGMGLNAFFAYTVVLGYGIPWQTALAGVLASGLIFIVFTLTGLREKIINMIPADLKLAVGAGIGFFIAFLGFQNAGIIIANEATLVGLGDLSSPYVLLAIFGLVVSIILLSLNIRGGIFYGMIITAIVGMIFGLIEAPKGISDIVSPAPSIASTFGQAIINFGDIFTLEMLVVILTFLFVDFFDTAGTLVAVATQAGLMKDNKLPRAGKALFANASATVVGSIVGTSTTTSLSNRLQESGLVVNQDLHPSLRLDFFLLALFFLPLICGNVIEVTAPALIIVVS